MAWYLFEYTDGGQEYKRFASKEEASWYAAMEGDHLLSFCPWEDTLDKFWTQKKT